MSLLGRLIVVAGAGAMAAAVALRWVTVSSLTLSIDLGIIGAKLTPASRTVAGTDTSVGPVLLGVAAVVALLALLGAGRVLLATVGALTIVAGGALLYYVSNVIEIETSGKSELERRLADLVLTSSPGPGPVVLIASGVLILLGAVLMRR